MTSYKESEASRNGGGHDALGCLVPLIAAAISVAIAVTLISWLWSPDAADDAATEQASQQASPDVVSLEELLSDLDLASNEPISTEAIFVVVRSLGWKAFGYPESYNLSSEKRAVHTFRRDGRHLQVTIHTHKNSARAEGVLDDVEPPAQAVQFDSRVVVVSPVGDSADAGDADAVAERLRRFRELLEPEAPPD
jgi:hypothetical protein